MAEIPKVNPESRLLIDGELVDASHGKTFDNVNPATEEVLGQVADGSPEDMERAIAAARRAFDETDWSTNRPSDSAVYASCKRPSRPTGRSCGRSSSRRSAALGC